MRILAPSQNRSHSNHRAQTVQSGMSSSMQDFGLENQRSVFRGFPNNMSSTSRPVLLVYHELNLFAKTLVGR